MSKPTIITMALAIYVSACSGTPANPAGASHGAVEVTAESSATPTEEPTATETASPTAVPTRDPDYKEWSADMFEVNLAIAQQGDPNASIAVKDCLYSDGDCVESIDYCPEGTECVGFMAVSPRASSANPDSDYLDSPGVAVGTDYIISFWEVEPFETTGLFVTDKERSTFVCEIRYEGNYILATESLHPVSRAVWNAFVANGAFAIEDDDSHRSLGECR